MAVYETLQTVKKTRRVVLADLPFAPGQQVKITVVAAEADRAELIRRWKALFDKLQALPASKNLTETEIQAEITHYRGSRA